VCVLVKLRQVCSATTGQVASEVKQGADNLVRAAMHRVPADVGFLAGFLIPSRSTRKSSSCIFDTPPACQETFFAIPTEHGAVSVKPNC
jgi:hypothetical protein